MDREALELLLGEGWSIERIARRFDRHPSTVSYWMQKFGLEAARREKHAAKGPITRERLRALVERSLTIGESAAEVGRSKTTVRHWLGRHGPRTQKAHAR